MDHSGAKPPAAALAPARIPDSATGSAAPGPVAAAPPGGVAGRAPPPGPVARDRAPIASLSEAVEIVGADAASGAYSVQVAATRSHAQSERELARVTRAVREVLPGADSHVLRVDLGEHSGVWYRARLGAFESVAAAEQACAAIEDRAGTQGCFVTPR